MDTKVKLRQRGAAIALAKRRKVRLSEIGRVIQAAFGEVYGYLGSHRVTPHEPPFLIYHGTPGPGREPFEIEICAPIGRPIDPPLGWRLVELPAGTFASTVHVGPYDTLGQTYDHLDAWLRSSEYVKAGPPREVYLSEPSTPPELTRTVVEYPVEEAKARAGAARKG